MEIRVGDTVRDTTGCLDLPGEVIDIIPQHYTVQADPPYDYSDREVNFRLLELRLTDGSIRRIAEDRVVKC